MPVYVYRCKNCGVQFEQQQSFKDQPLTRCPECTKKTLVKVFMPVGIVFKGSGFYSTDHRSPSGGGRNSKEKSADSDKAAEKSSEKSTPDPAKSEAKPEAKSD
jgi:putative FmdB family regulatory protein